MAKIKTPKDLIEEAKNVMAEARRKQAALIQEAKELEEKKFAELGKKYIDFLEGKCTMEDLKNTAKKSGLLEERVENKQSEESVNV